MIHYKTKKIINHSLMIFFILLIIYLITVIFISLQNYFLDNVNLDVETINAFTICIIIILTITILSSKIIFHFYNFKKINDKILDYIFSFYICNGIIIWVNISLELMNKKNNKFDIIIIGFIIFVLVSCMGYLIYGEVKNNES